MLPAVCRKREFPSSAGYPRKTKGTALERKSSFSGRPFLHQYEVKGQLVGLAVIYIHVYIQYTCIYTVYIYMYIVYAFSFI